MHEYPKPITTLGHGVVMGGGFGLLSASAFRVLTERSRLAFPEITIGLFPDAGGSWVLRQLPLAVAAFLGLTGSQLNARDALELGIGSHVIEHETRDQLVPQLAELPWGVGADEANKALLENFLATLHKQPSQLPNEIDAIPDWSVRLRIWRQPLAPYLPCRVSQIGSTVVCRTCAKAVLPLLRLCRSSCVGSAADFGRKFRDGTQHCDALCAITGFSRRGASTVNR